MRVESPNSLWQSVYSFREQDASQDGEQYYFFWLCTPETFTWLTIGAIEIFRNN